MVLYEACSREEGGEDNDLAIYEREPRWLQEDDEANGESLAAMIDTGDNFAIPAMEDANGASFYIVLCD